MQDQLDNHSNYSLFSNHALLRIAQRNLSEADVWFVMDYGVLVNRAGATFFFLGKNNIPSEMRSQKQFSRLEGTIIATGSDSYDVITIYRNRRTGFRDIRTKKPYFRPK